MHYVIRDAGLTMRYFSNRGRTLIDHKWSKDVEEAMKFPTVSNAACMCGELNFTLINIVKVEAGAPILTVL
jgi:hypothetical protein